MPKGANKSLLVERYVICFKKLTSFKLILLYNICMYTSCARLFAHIVTFGFLLVSPLMFYGQT